MYSITFLQATDSSTGVNRNINSTIDEQCATNLSYSGLTVCKEELKSLSNCLPSYNDGNGVFIQSNQSENFFLLLDALNSTSNECRDVALPFFCVYFFGLCDSTGKAYRPSYRQCVDISTNLCATEWLLIGNISNLTLPNCESFPNETVLTDTCVENKSNSKL